MVERFNPVRQCHQKNTYSSKAEGKAAIKQLQVQGRLWREKGKMVVYRCPHCDSFHIGHQRPKEAHHG